MTRRTKRAPARPARAAARPARPKASKTARGSPAYHHGDLHNALLAATEALLEEAGLGAFTLREVARRAGVSHGAPAHHFHDVRGLLTAFTAESFTGLADMMAARRRAASPDPFEQLAATGIGYVEYALAHRARFQLMFRSEWLDQGHGALIAASARAYGQLTDCIAALGVADGTGVSLAAPRTALAWSIVHGFATLMIDNQLFAVQAGGVRSRALAQVEAVLRLSRPAFARAP